MTGYTDLFQPERMDQFIKECNDCSDDTILLIPGLEITCSNGRHIMGIGLEKFVGADIPEHVVEEIEEAGGTAALSHPLKHGTSEVPKNLEFMEIWNGKCAGQVLPDFKVLSFFRKNQKNNPDMKCVAGLDLHKTADMVNLDIVMDLPCLGQAEFLRSMRKGAYRLQLGVFTFWPRGEWPYSQRLLAFVLRCIVRLRDSLRGFEGIKAPTSLEALIKRLVGQNK